MIMNYLAAATNKLSNLPASEGIIFFGAYAVPTSEVLKSLRSITEEETEVENEVCYYLTPKGQDGKTFSLPTKTRRAQKKSIPVNKKRSLQSYQNELVAEPALPTHNSFSPLRIVRNNSSTAHIRATGEILRVVSFAHKPRRMTPKPNPKIVENTTITAIHKAHRQQGS